MGSVKDIIDLPADAVLPKHVDQNRNLYKVFKVSERFSVFDLKDRIKDRIPLKDMSLCMMAANDFEFLEGEGFKTHYIGLLDENNKVVSTKDLDKPSNRLVFRVYNFFEDKVIFNEADGTYDYSFFKKNRGKLNQYVVLLECVFRNGAPEGSSLFRKTIPKWQKNGDTKSINNFLNRAGLRELPQPGDMFPNTIYDFWTKVEREDRPVGDDSNYEEAYEISGLSREQFELVVTTIAEVPKATGKYLKSVGIDLYDGKREFAWDDGPRVADFPATLDEDRWLRNGRQISKEFVRQYMEKKMPDFYQHMLACKEQAEKKGLEDFRELLQMEIPRFPKEILELAGNLYAATADVVLQRPMFHDIYGTPKLDDLMSKVDEVNRELKAQK